MSGHARIVLTRPIITALAGFLLHASPAEAGVIIVGSPAWQQQQQNATSAPSDAAAPWTDEKPDSPRPGYSSAGSPPISVPVVQNRHHGEAQLTREIVPPGPSPTARWRDNPRIRWSSPYLGGIFRPPKDVSAAEISLV